MKMVNPQGEAVYYNIVTKRGKERYIIVAANPMTIVLSRDGQKRKSRSFSQEAQALAYLSRHKFKGC